MIHANCGRTNEWGPPHTLGNVRVILLDANSLRGKGTSADMYLMARVRAASTLIMQSKACVTAAGQTSYELPFLAGFSGRLAAHHVQAPAHHVQAPEGIEQAEAPGCRAMG